jgi:hypothetical protein
VSLKIVNYSITVIQTKIWTMTNYYNFCINDVSNPTDPAFPKRTLPSLSMSINSKICGEWTHQEKIFVTLLWTECLDIVKNKFLSQNQIPCIWGKHSRGSVRPSYKCFKWTKAFETCVCVANLDETGNQKMKWDSKSWKEKNSNFFDWER